MEMHEMDVTILEKKVIPTQIRKSLLPMFRLLRLTTMSLNSKNILQFTFT